MAAAEVLEEIINGLSGAGNWSRQGHGSIVWMMRRTILEFVGMEGIFFEMKSPYKRPLASVFQYPTQFYLSMTTAAWPDRF